MAGITSLGRDWPTVAAALREGRSGIRYMANWERFPELRCRLAGPVVEFSPPTHFTRKTTRTMGRVALLAVCATEAALADAGLLGDPAVADGSTGVAYGSSTGSTDAALDFVSLLTTGVLGNINATTYLRMMSHTAAVNIAVHFGVKGRIVPTVSACASGSQGIGYAYEAIKFGKQTLMVAGGAEELCPSESAVFDTLLATSTRNHAPHTTPRPFDRDRDGLVIGEGAATLVLEDLDHARARGAHVHAEIVGFASNCDGSHATQPNATTMAQVMRMALDDAGIPPSAIAYVNAHGTATERGDIAESQATRAVFCRALPLSSLKGHFGHSLGACGAIEAWLSIEMMNAGWFAPTLNLEHVDPRCAELDYLTGEPRALAAEQVMSNNFAFGGINTSLVFQRLD